jgi:hypothetical protein
MAGGAFFLEYLFARIGIGSGSVRYDRRTHACRRRERNNGQPSPGPHSAPPSIPVVLEKSAGMLFFKRSKSAVC